MKQSTKVLIITYYWPPAGGAGVQRWLKFVKYLREFDCEPVILTPENGAYPHEDHTLLEDIPEGLKVYKTKTFEPFGAYNKLLGKKGKSVPAGFTSMRDSKSLYKRFAMYVRANFFVPDARKGWVKYARKAAARIIKEEKIDVVVTTGPPHSTHLTGLWLKRKFGTPWLVDFRDPWTTIYYNSFLPRTKRAKAKDRRLEDEVLKSADCLTVVGNTLLAEFEERAQRSEVVYNGFDETDLSEKAANETDRFNLVYTGNFKPNQNVPALWKALSELIRENESFKTHFKLEFTGIIDQGILADIEASGLQDHLKTDGFVPHTEATRRMSEAALLLFVVPQIATNKIIITGKVFEYIASHSPILSIGPTDGDAAGVLQQCERDPVIDYADVQAMKSLVLSYFESWLETQKRFKHTGTSYLNFTRKKQTERMAEILNSLAS